MATQNPNPNLFRGSVLPGGSMEESAMFRGSVDVSHQLPAAHDSGLRHKVENLKSRGLAVVQTAKRSLSTRVTRANESMRGGVHNGMSQMQQSMREKPMLWAGIAGGTGVALGLIGRFVHWRNHRAVPDLVIIDATC